MVVGNTKNMGMKDWGVFSKVLVAACAVEVLAIVAAVAFAGGGHGIYGPAALLFPYTMFSTRFFEGIAIPFRIVALVQFPVYGTLIGWAICRSRAKMIVWAITTIHALAALAAVLGRGQSFCP